MLKSDEDLKKVPAHFVVQVLERVESWLEVNAPEVKARPTDEIHAGEFNLTRICTYKLSTLVELASLGVRQHMTDQDNKMDTAARAWSN